MIRYLLDTDICIDLIRDRDEALKLKLYEKGIGCVAISTITLAELSYGAEKSRYVERNRLALALFLTPFELLPFTAPAAFVYGTIRQQLEKGGQLIGSYDMLITAQALAEGLVLVTNNVKEFSRVAGLHVENWSGRQ